MKVQSFESLQEYTAWIAEMGDKVRVVNLVPSFKPRSLWERITDPNGTRAYVVTYHLIEEPPRRSTVRHCSHCGTDNDGEYRFCEQCGFPLFKPAALPGSGPESNTSSR